MGRKAIIFGNRNLAKMLKRYLQETGINVCAFCVDTPYIKSDTFENLPLVSFDHVHSCYPPDDYAAYIAVGYSQMGQVRMNALERLRKKGYELPNYIHPTVYVFPDMVIGQANLILEDAKIGMMAEIGSGNLIWPGANVGHNSIVGDGNTISLNAILCGFAEVEDNCFIGAGSCVRDYVHVAAFTLVGGNTFIDQNTEKYSVYVAPKAAKIKKESLDVRL